MLPSLHSRLLIHTCLPSRRLWAKRTGLPGPCSVLFSLLPSPRAVVLANRTARQDLLSATNLEGSCPWHVHELHWTSILHGWTAFSLEDLVCVAGSRLQAKTSTPPWLHPAAALPSTPRKN
ncbi:hypothetical protein BDW02DRAFT_283578 [Decorospora gaudefroyi]|uniref:Uncharacterized protein n=1 Tax=Decorospora gaudefroyi TaxID=184978 RepID=A0A6A5KH51_9PLEO|nr:hypothetical protein BDW02DRAFT_283578 [Decorospora gaudefroyi]